MRNTDLLPVQYLDQRVKYYKKQKRKFKSFKKNKYLLTKYNTDKIDDAEEVVDALIKIYSLAIEVLKKHKFH